MIKNLLIFLLNTIEISCTPPCRVSGSETTLKPNMQLINVHDCYTHFINLCRWEKDCKAIVIWYCKRNT